MTTGYAADREMHAQADPAERGRRLRAAAAMRAAATVDGETLRPLGEGFAFARTIASTHPAYTDTTVPGVP